jgi:hypothetical protein
MPKTSGQRTRQDILRNETSDHLAQQFQFTLEKDGKQSAVNIATWNLLGQCTQKDQEIGKGANSKTLEFANNPWNYKEESREYYKKHKTNQETGRKAAQKNKITELAKGNDVICLQEANGYDKGYLDEICSIMGEGWKFIKVAGKEGSESDGFESDKKGKSKQLVILYNSEKCELESKNKTLLNIELNCELRCGLELIFKDKKNGEKFAIHNVHVPQDKDLVDKYYAEETVKDRPFPTITVGDMNNHVSKYQNKKSYHAISCEEATNFDAQIIKGSYKADDSYQVTQDKCYDMALLRLPSGYSAKCTVQGRFFKADLSSKEVTKTFENIKPNLELQSDSQAEKSKSEKVPPIDSSSDVNRKDYKVTLNQETKKENHSTANSAKQEKAGSETPPEDDQKLKTAAHKKDQGFESADQAKKQEGEVKNLKETKKENHSAETSNKSPDGSKKQEKTVKKIPLKVDQKTKTTTDDQKLRTDLHKKDQGSKSSDQAKEQEGEVKNLTDLKKYFKVSELKTPTTDRSDTFKNTFSDVKSADKELEDKYGTSGIEGTKRLLEMELTEKDKVFKNKLTRALNKLASACEQKKKNAGNLETWEKLTTLDKRVLVDYYNSNLAEGKRKIEFKSLYEKTAENGELKIQDQNYALSDFGKKKVTEITSRVYDLAIPKTSPKSLFAENLKNGDRQQYR